MVTFKKILGKVSLALDLPLGSLDSSLSNYSENSQERLVKLVGGPYISDIRRENQNCWKIGSVARKIKKLILSNFFFIESTSKISVLRHEKLNFSWQEHHRDVNSFDNENWEQYLTFFYTSGLKLPLSMRKIALLLKNGKRIIIFWCI